MKTDLHIGTTPWDFNSITADNLCEQAVYAEQLGFDSFWLPENHFGKQALPEPLMLLASVAGVTEKIKLATTSYLLTIKNPLQAAEQVAVLDQLSSGRVILGVGRGFAPEMLKAFSIPIEEKRKIFAWALGIMRDAWAGKKVSLDSTNEAVYVYPQPMQKPEPPIWIAAFGPKALAQAGKLGLPYLASPMESLSKLESNYLIHQEAATSVGVAVPKIVPVMRSLFISEDSKEIKKLKGILSNQADDSSLNKGETVDDWAILGSANEVADKIELFVERIGVTHLIATRLRIPGIMKKSLRESVAHLAQLYRDAGKKLS